MAGMMAMTTSSELGDKKSYEHHHSQVTRGKSLKVLITQHIGNWVEAGVKGLW